ncbi:radical SAM protein [Flavobacterium sp. ov086]|uniref:radical SAM protein n=1 Tax=Flavobacterium sp. ov086 TaxID=1761785 RepID=UPI000B72145F|nr:radical SAM protein [Flavobacterium sp. ov086]SNR95151.1 uncharacterized protein SAMN04487979_1343 [Flavobacterium sp. ov086]
MKIDKFVVKVASRCNINCSYCYMYNLGDLSYKNQPKFISDTTIKSFVKKLKNHIQVNELKIVHVVIHGGEPLLWNKVDFENFMLAFKEITNENIEIFFSMQTNAILLNDEWCDFLKKHKINIGVSLDGSKINNDKHRVDKKGNGTYDDVIKGLNVLTKNGIKAGILSVMNLESDPIEYYNHFNSLNLRSIDILLLDSNYDSKTVVSNHSKKVWEWYIKIFDKWYHEKGEKSEIRFFEMIIREVLGEEQNIDSLGSHENNLLVLETNGGLEAVDALKLCGDSFTKNELNINSHEIDEISKSNLMEVYYNSGKYLPKKCLACPVQDICGGGYLPHRYSSKNGFNNPSIYCDDLLRIITHIQNTVVEDMPKELKIETGIQKLTYENALQIIEETLPNISEPDYIELLESFRKKEYETI